MLEHHPRRLLDIGVGGGGDRVDRHPLAHARLARVNPRRHRLQQVALGQDPDQVAEVLDDDGADVLGRHPLGNLAERVLGRDLDEVGAHHIGDPGHGAILSQGLRLHPEPPREIRLCNATNNETWYPWADAALGRDSTCS